MSSSLSEFFESDSESSVSDGDGGDGGMSVREGFVRREFEFARGGVKFSFSVGEVAFRGDFVRFREVFRTGDTGGEGMA